LNEDKQNYPEQKDHGGAVGVYNMHYLRELKTVLFGWHVMQRQCYVEKQSAMKNYEEFRGRTFKLEFDASSNSFGYVPLSTEIPLKSAETILFKPKPKAQEKPNRSSSKTRRTA
jgi:hypothetical protein